MTGYDLAQRERIRQTLLDYMKEHKIGVPRLAQRVKETVHRNPEIPVKSLQRFMKGEVRTIDMHVGFLAQFVEKASRSDPIPRLASALTAFYSSQDKTDWSGVFTASESDQGGSKDSTIYESKLQIGLDGGTWRVKEIGDNDGTHEIYDGALTASGPTLVVVMKDRLMGLPRTMTVSKKGSGDLEGVATAAYYPRAIRGVITSLAVRTRSSRIVLK
jgi:hypothetical protein